MIALVLDTNAWLDWLVFNDRSTRALDRAARAGVCRFLSTDRTRSEWRSVLARDTLRNAVLGGRPELSEALDQLTTRYDHWTRRCAEPANSALRPTDPDDQVFIDLAIAERASWLLTRDRALLTLGRRALREYSLRIAPPEQFTDVDPCVAAQRTMMPQSGS